MKSRKNKKFPTRAKRYKKKNAQNLDYNNLEPRQMLAADFLSAVNFQDGGTDLVNLGHPVAVTEGAELLRDRLNLGNNESLRLLDHSTDQIGFEHFKYQQFFNNIAVEGSNYTIHVKDSMIVSMSGDRVAINNPVTGVALSNETALQFALDYTGASQYAWQDPAMAEMLGFDGAPTGELVYLTNINGQSVPVYKFDIYAIEPSTRDFVYVNANSGMIDLVTSRIVEADVNADGETHYDGTVEFFADSTGNGDFRLQQVANGVQTFDNNEGPTGNFGGATDIISATTTFDDPSTTSGVQAHWGAEVMLQYLQDAFGRDSYDDAGSPLISYVNVSTNLVNAFWNGSVMQYGEGNGTTAGPVNALDVVGHEIAHGVTEFSANLVYANEPGALNESFSDIFGELVESAGRNGNNDWLIGGDVFWTSPDDALRSFLDPNKFDQPDTYMGDLWFTGGGDNGGVHYNSGVQNRWYYLLSEGGIGTNDNGEDYDVTGIGMDEAAQIAYRNLTTYLGVNSQYQDARDGAVQSAIDLYGEGSDQHVATNLAWRAVGVYGEELEIYDVEELLAGSLIFQGSTSGSVGDAGPVPVFISIEAGQTIGITVVGKDGLVPTIDIQDPNGISLGTASANVETVVISSVAVSMAGKYSLFVGGDSGSEGDFDIVVTLNAAVETEASSGFSNGDLASAQDINSTSYQVSLPGADVVDRVGAVGEFSLSESPNLDEDGFESGSLNGQWSTTSTDAFGRIQVSDQYGSAEGNFALLMDQQASGIANLNEAIWTVDLSGTSDPLLSFYHAEWNDENTSLPFAFNNSIFGDGVSVSADGQAWYTVLTDTETPAGEWSLFTVNLGDVANANGISLNSNFQIKFQQYDDDLLGSDGRGYDGIQIKSSVISDDWYSFALDAGQSTTLAAQKFAAAGQVGIELYDSAGTLLETSTSTAELDAQISQFVANATDTYFARLTGKSTGYAFMTLRGGSFDTGSDPANPLDLGVTGSVLGFAGAVDDAVADADEALDKTLVSNYFDGITLSNAITGGDVYAAAAPFNGPSGNNVFAPSPTSPSGWRQGTNELRVDFDISQADVKIDVGSDDGNDDISFLRAYDSNGILLDEAYSQSLPAGESQTLRVTHNLGEIAYVIAAGVGNDVAPLGNIQFEVAVDKRDFYAFDVQQGQKLKITAQFPGTDPFLFKNRLVNDNGIEFRMELMNSAGQVIAIGENEINFVAAETGTMQLIVYANTGEGDYFISTDVRPEQYFDIGPLGNGIAVADNATGSGFLMYSVESVHTRFSNKSPWNTNADHLIAVRYNDGAGTWEYNNNSTWIAFESRGEDRLVASVDFDVDTVESLQDTSGAVQGIMVGFIESDLTFRANRWNGSYNTGEFEAMGTYFLTDDTRIRLNPLNMGIAVDDAATGTAFLMYSDESVHTRLAAKPPHSGNSDHLIAVRYNSGLGSWEYNANKPNWYTFAIAATDRLIATLDFDADTVNGLQGAFGMINGIVQGYAAGDLVFRANRWNGTSNGGEFQVEGNFFTITDTMGDMGDMRNGIAVADNAIGLGYLMYSLDSVHSRFAANAPHYNNSDHLIAVRYNTGSSTWEYNNNSNNWYAFVLNAGDRLLASLDFDANTMTSLEGTNTLEHGVFLGYQTGDLTFLANRWDGSYNSGEFQVLGTYFTA